MNWIPLTNAAQLDTIKADSFTRPVIIFKHSKRCSISNMVIGRLERAEQPAATDFYYLDLLSYRPLSQAVAEVFSVHHESPQLLLIRNGECVYEESHNGIDMAELKLQIA